MTNGVALLSGGMDSTTLVYDLVAQEMKPHLLLIEYGQRHVKELFFAERTAEKLGLQHHIVDLTGITELIGTSALTYGQEVPDGHYAEENMKQTIVPNRNMMMLAIATAVAVAEKGSYVSAAMHAGDHYIYPDCRPAFINALDTAVALGNDEAPQLNTPYIHITKARIVSIGDDLGVPWQDTWSCYKGGEIHCGKCGTCVERQEAFYEAEVKDPTPYEDPNYWKTVTKIRRVK